MRVLILALAVLAGGCQTLADDERLPPDQERFTCNAARVQGLVGQTASQAVGTDAVRGSGARTMRWIAPGTMVTMDYRTDRLNIHLDAQNKVTRIVCG
jgi:hypothetical protein